MTKSEARNLAASLWRLRDLAVRAEEGFGASPSFVCRVEGAALLAQALGEPGEPDNQAILCRLEAGGSVE